MAYYENKWLVGLKEDLESHFNQLETSPCLKYHEIEVEYVRDQDGKVKKHPVYYTYEFRVVQHMLRQWNIGPEEDYKWELKVKDQEYYYRIVTDVTRNKLNTCDSCYGPKGNCRCCGVCGKVRPPPPMPPARFCLKNTCKCKKE